MTKPDDLYECEHCGCIFWVDRVNGKKGHSQYECSCGRLAGRWPEISEGYGRHFEVKLTEVK